MPGAPYRRFLPPKIEPSTPRTISRPTELPMVRTALFAIAVASDSGSRRLPRGAGEELEPPNNEEKNPPFCSPLSTGGAIGGGVAELVVRGGTEGVAGVGCSCAHFNLS